MKKVILLCAMILASITQCLYADSTSNNTLPLYTDANANSKVIQQLNSQQVQAIQPFYQQGHWLKVGDKTTGNVGWVDQQQYQQMLRKNLPAIQSTYIYSEQKNNQPVKVVAYENGKQLDDKQAQALYQQMQQRAWQMQQQIGKQMQFIQQQMNDMWQDVNQLWRPVVITQTATNKPVQPAATPSPAKEKTHTVKTLPSKS